MWGVNLIFSIKQIFGLSELDWSFLIGFIFPYQKTQAPIFLFRCSSPCYCRHAYLIVSNKLVVSCLQVPLLDKQKAFGKDLNLVFWTDNQRKINPDLIEGKCYLRSQQSIQNSNETVESWTKAGEYRFYFNQYYNKEAKEITGDLPYKAENYGATVSKGKGGKGKGK